MTAPRPRLASHGASPAAWVRRPRWRKWRSRIYVNGKSKHLGYYDSPAEARAAFAEAVREYLGEQYLQSEDRLA
jgi:hypothetical protein